MAPTSPEEIARQHGEAVALTDAGAPCAPRIDWGEVPLRLKSRPTCPNDDDPAAKPPSRPASRGGEEKKEGNGSDGDGDDARLSSSSSIPDWCVSSRGQIDVSALVDLIREGVNDPAAPLNGGGGGAKSEKKASPRHPPRAAFSPTNLWDETNAATNNVAFARPSHDAWGIKKIALVFCDDFLRTVYDLPWYRRDDDDDGGGAGSSVGSRMRRAVQPVLDVLNVSEDRVVRCLLAGLPPGVTIPVHHDTGEWVRRTHRIHVPVYVPDPGKVVFRCGLEPRSLDRIDCEPGHVFEMNNQAKHAVTNAHPTEFRVHLILDYVDDTSVAETRRVELAPGEVLSQTRRSIDRVLDAGTRPCPSFLILGAQKAGTTALYDYLNQHPLVVRARRRETHCLDWRWDGTASTAAARRDSCLKFYHADQLSPHPSLLTGDSTPSYLLDHVRVIPRLKEVFPHGPKLFVMVRDPVRRAVSHFAMVTSEDGSPKQIQTRGTGWRHRTFEEVARRDIADLKAEGVLPYWDEKSGTADADAFRRFANTDAERRAWDSYVSRRIPLGTGSYAPIARGLYALQMRPWLRSFPRDRFLVLRLEDMTKGGGVQTSVDRAFRHLDLPPLTLKDVEKKNARSYDVQVSDDFRAMLRRFFEPHNELFGRMMVEEMECSEKEWAHPWRED